MWGGRTEDAQADRRSPGTAGMAHQSGQPAESELYFLIARYLSNGPCSKSAEMLIRELNEFKLLPNRLDWKGNAHSRTYDEMVSANKCVSPDHLLKICQSLTSFLDNHSPASIPRGSSLLGLVKPPPIRTEKGYRNAQWNQKSFATLQRGRPPELPVTIKKPPNIVSVHSGKHLAGATRFTSAFPVNMYQQIKMQKRILGHLSSVYCVAFDRTGQRIFTGSDDCLVKIWSAIDGRLLATLRGHSAEISELTVNCENTLIAAASCEKIIRVWSLKTCAPVAVLQGHSVSVTSLLFSPLVKGSLRYLVSTGGDATVCLWRWNADTLQFNDRPVKFIEKSGPGVQMLCCSCSVGGMFMAVGGSDHAIRIYYFGGETPEKVSELEGHADIIDSILFSFESERFVSGSKDGTAQIWGLKQQEWHSITLDMSTKMDDRYQCSDIPQYSKPKVLMIAWDLTDNFVVTACSAHLLKVWDSHTGSLLHILKGHENDIFVLEPHPFDHRVMLSAGYDGNIFLWDIISGVQVLHCFNAIEGQGHGAILDCKLSSDGQRMAGTDSHGHLLIFGFGSSKIYDKIPDQMFFHTDYRPLCRDANNFVLDEQTQQAPHLMPPPFLVDVDGNPHPTRYQRLVPGREKCAEEHLIPQLGYVETSDGEVVEQVISQQTNYDQQNQQEPSILDGMIRQLQLQQDQRQGVEQEPGSSMQARQAEAGRRDLISPPNIGLRRSGQVEGVRQMHQNSPLSQIATERDLLAWKRRVVVPEIPNSVFRLEQEYRIARGEQEKVVFAKHKRRFRDSSQESDHYIRNVRFRKKTSRARTFRFAVEEFIELSAEEKEETTSSVFDEETEENPAENSTEAASEEEEWGNNTSDSSSEYSDWTADAGIHLHPPSRVSTRRKVKKWVSSSEEESSAEEKSAEEKSTEEKSTPSRKKSSKPKSPKEATPRAQRTPVNRELLSDWRPSAWITDTNPRRSPFVPQMGDEVVYFRQGHEGYINAVRRNNLSILTSLKEPWKKCVLRDQELVKIVGIRYDVGPPTLCCLKLALIDHVSGKFTGQSFSLKYHDMPDVIDFLVLRQFFDHARRTNWQAGDRFRSIIDDAWWFGTVLTQEPYQSEYPDSLFQCYSVKWDNTEIERLSPWDMDVIPDDMDQPAELGTSVSITLEEQDALLYRPQEGEWGDGDSDSQCERIICGIDQLLNMELAAPFSAPVDLNTYPAYCLVVAYPTDISTIRMRLVNRFYRRLSALIWEVRYIEQNASVFNEPGSNITKSAKKIADLLLKFIMDSNCTSIADLWNAAEEPESCEAPPQSPVNVNSWKQQCMELVDFVIECEDSEPFREPVDLEQYPDYHDVVKTPMDFGTIKEKVSSEGYGNPLEFCKDMRLVFSNAKLYTPNKRSRIYSMVLRLSALVEEKVKVILSDYKIAKKSREGPEDTDTTRRPRAKEGQQSRISLSSVRHKKVKQRRSSPHPRLNSSLLDMSSPPTSSGATSATIHTSISSSSASHARGQSTNSAIAPSVKTRVSKRLRSDSFSDSSSDSSSSSSTSASAHSSHSSSSSSDSKSNGKKDCDSNTDRENGSKTRAANSRHKRATQGNNQKRTASGKRKNSSYSEEQDSASEGSSQKGARKKTLRKCAAMAASKIKCMSDVEDSASSSDSDCSASKNSRKLPTRTAAAKAKRRFLDGSEEETALNSDCDQVIKKRSVTRTPPRTCPKSSRVPQKVKSDSSIYSSDNSVTSPSPKRSAYNASNKGDHHINGGSQSTDERSDTPCTRLTTSSRRCVVESDSDSSSAESDVTVLKKPPSPLYKRQPKECRVVLTNVCLTGAGEFLRSPRLDQPSPQTDPSSNASDTESDSDSESESLCTKRRKRIVSSLASPPARKTKVLSYSEAASDSGTEYTNCRFSTAEESSPPKKNSISCSGSESALSEDTGRAQINGRNVSTKSRALDQKRKRTKSSCDDDWEDMDAGRRKKLTRRTKIRTRNQGRRTVRYDDETEVAAQSDERLNAGRCGTSSIRRESIRERARQFLR